ncbi:hypothetical protein ACHAPV_003208 [Trichoderma viride]
MAFHYSEPIGQAETADEYGRRKDCFRNYREHPFTFQSYLTDLQSTKEVTGRDGLVSQPGLKAGVLPNPQIAAELLDQDQHHRKNAERLLYDSPPSYFLPAANSHIKELFVPVEDLDLGSCPKHDLQNYLCPVWAKRYDNPFEQWLPLASTRTDRDESLDFPPVLSRLRAQICREIETDKPIISDAAAELVRKVDKPITASEYQDLIKRQTRIGPCQYSCVEPISPPLSPISDDAVPFIPDGNVTVIDLVSEPNSPDRTAIEDSEPIVSSTFMTSSPTRELPQLFQAHNAVIEEAKVDLPVVFTSSYSPSRENILADICLPLMGLEEDAIELLQERGHFEDAFMTLLDDRQYHANRLVSQERLDPADSISRIPVPLLDFGIQPPTLDFITIRPELEILRITEDDELEEVYVPEEAYVADAMTDDMPPVILAEQHENTNRMNSPQRNESVYFQNRNSPDPSRELRRKADDSMRLLPKCYDTSATKHVWSPESLLDIDYSEHIAILRPSDSAQCKETTTSGLSFEADVSLSPVTGIIVTNILKVRQRPLPGSQSQSPLRDRVQKVSQKYETLLVLVSESHPIGEFSGELAPSDIAAYADFVSFTVALDGDINAQLVPGAEQTMASWISACLSQSSFKFHGMKRLLSSEETEWEIFLRRAGMNVFAAKILSKTLFEQAGASGLAAFLTMPVQERVARFAPLLGGEKGLCMTAKALDRSWAQ